MVIFAINRNGYDNIKANPKEALKWMLSAGNQEHSSAQVELALYYLTDAPIIEVETGLRWFHRAIKNGYKNPQFREEIEITTKVCAEFVKLSDEIKELKAKLAFYESNK